MEMKKNKRLCQYELMRIVAMFMIVLHHICVHGDFPNGLSVYQFNRQSFYIQSMSSFGKVGVFLFMMITGFFLSQTRPKIKKIWPILIQTTFYLSVGYFVLLRNAQQAGTMSWYDLRQVLFASFYPFTGYWFINAYVMLYVLTPFINLSIQKMDRKMFQRCLFILTIVLCFSGIITKNERPLGDVGLVLLPYLFGAYFRRYPIKVKKRYLGSFLLALLLVLNIEIYFIDNYGESLNLGVLFASPIYPMRDISLFVIGFSVGLFLLLQQVQVRSIWVQDKIFQISKCMLGVYLLHDNRIIRPRLAAHLSRFFHVGGIKVIFPIIGAAVFVFILSIGIERMRQLLFAYVLRLWHRRQEKERNFGEIVKRVESDK